VAEHPSDKALIQQAGERARLLAAALTDDAAALRPQHPDGAALGERAAQDAAVLADLFRQALDRHGEPPPSPTDDESDPT
jgi:hypothetical protein